MKRGGAGPAFVYWCVFVGCVCYFPPPPAHAHTTTSDVYGSYVIHGAAATDYLFAP